RGFRPAAHLGVSTRLTSRWLVLACAAAIPSGLRAQCPDGTPPPCRPARAPQAGPPPAGPS
ncbi:MAG: peptidoglycan DD-metalloendopeptidase family protein, partial [Gemmatimonadales bacterium]